MSEQKSSVPALKELYDRDGLETTAKQNDLNIILNAEPKKEWLKEHPTVKIEGRPLLYLPIERVEWLLTNIFVEWRVEVLNVSMHANSIAVTIRLHVKNPVTGEWTFNDGVGASPLQTNKDAGAIDWNQIKSAAVQMALPAAKSYAISDAADCFGRIFGKDLNRKSVIEYGNLSGKFSEEKSEIQKLEKEIRDALEIYQGDDKGEIRQMCFDKKKAQEFDVKFAKEVLSKLGIVK